MGTGLIAANLRRLREQKGWTQERLAVAAGLSRLAYRNIETRKSVPRADTLQRLSAALEVGLGELVAPIEVLQNVRFRSLKRLNSRETVLVEVARQLRDFNELERVLGVSRSKPASIQLPAGKRRAVELARSLRTRWKIHNQPIRDICGFLERHGYKVLLVEIGSDGFFGLSIGGRDGGPAVVVNRWERISVERRIFTAAHELGHLLLHHDAFDVNKTAEERDEEQEANLFASHFLMPDELFRREWDETYGLPFLRRVFKVKRMFKVSYKSVLYRLAEGRRGGTNYFAKFNMDYRRQFGRSISATDEPEGLRESDFHEPEPLRAGEPQELLPVDFEEDGLAALVRQAVEKDLITLSRAAEILKKSVAEMRELSASWVQ
jgi:Zn-dependent peptidase ImmA (M78 family)/DNA-binding XRE family transcriptional regulator